MSQDAIILAHRVGTALAEVTDEALLLAHADRYAQWVRTHGIEPARLRAIDALSRTDRLLEGLGEQHAGASANLWELQTPLRHLLVEVVAWNGTSALPDGAVAAAQATLPLLGVAPPTDQGFDACEAPTIPTLPVAGSPLESLDQELVDEATEVRLLLRGFLDRAQLSAALVANRSGELIAIVTRDEEPTTEDFPERPHFNRHEYVGDLLERSDLFVSVSSAGKPAAVRLTGAHALLAGAASTSAALEILRDPRLGWTMTRLLESFRSRVDRTSNLPAPPGPSHEDPAE